MPRRRIKNKGRKRPHSYFLTVVQEKEAEKNTTKGWFPKEAPTPNEDAANDVGPSSSPPTQDIGPSQFTPPRPKRDVLKLTPRKKKDM
jgi:hypothetical protein